MSGIAITGSSSGIGAATRSMLEASGRHTIGVDIRDADVTADLSTPEGRAEAVAGVIERCAGVLDGLVLCAGLGAHVRPAPLIYRVNYFGVVELLDGLLPALARGTNPSAVVVSSVASLKFAFDGNPIGAALEARDDARAAAIIEAGADKASYVAYAGSKNAVTVAVRRRAVEWGRAGIRLNSVAPGATETPLHHAARDDPRFSQAVRDFTATVPIGRSAEPEEVASAIVFLLGSQASYIHGTQLCIDGGVDAVTRPTQF